MPHAIKKGKEIGPDTLKNNQIISPSSIVCAPCAASRILYIVENDDDATIIRL